MIRKITFLLLSFLSMFPVRAEENKPESVDRIPKIHGVFRGRYEGEWPDYEQRFQVRNARVSVEGLVLPELSYYFRFDISDRGKMKFLDGYANWKIGRGFAVRAGQFRVPFGVDAFRGPGSYIFANRAFLVKQMANVRQVGLQLGYTFPSFPLTLQAGVFNSKPMGDHEVWQDAVDFAAKASLRLGNVTLSPSFLTMKPYAARTNHADMSVSWKWERWLVEGEYQYLHYCRDMFRDVNGWAVFASYTLPVDFGRFNEWNFHGRFDGITDYSDGKTGDDGLLQVSVPARRRITVGTSLAFVQKPVRAEILLDYEKYFYDSGVTAPRGAGDKIVAELIVKF